MTGQITPDANTSRGRLDHVDGLRGLAAILVVLGHWAEFISIQAVPPALAHGLRRVFLDWFSTGRVGVVAFFCVSGFVIPFSFKGARPLRAFVISRIFRLYPAYWVAIGLAVLLLPLIGLRFTTWNVAVNATMLTKFLGQPYVLGVAWTLTIELIFYTICFVAFAAGQLHLARFNLAMMLIFCILAVAMGGYRWTHPGSEMPAGVMTFLAAMHFGTLVRLWRIEGDRAAARLGPIALVVLCGAVVAANTLGYFHANPAAPEADIGWIAINTGYLAGVALFGVCVMRRWFASVAMVFLGGISYSLYLLHPIALNLFGSLWTHFPTSWVLTLLVLTTSYVIVSIVVSTIVYRWIERPFVRFGHRLTAPRQRTDQADFVR